MQRNLIGFGNVDGLGSSCGCSGVRRSGMAGFGAGPDGLGVLKFENVVLENPTTIGLAVSGLVGVAGYVIGGAIGRKMGAKSPALTGAVAGASTAILFGVIDAFLLRKETEAYSNVRNLSHGHDAPVVWRA